MPYGIYTLKLTFGGAMPSGEVWQSGMRMSVVTPPAAQSDLQALATSFAAPLKTWWEGGGMSAILCSGITLNQLSLYEYLPGATHSSRVAHAPIAAATVVRVPLCPNQVALVASLRTVDPSAKGRARMYLPAGGTTISSNAQAGTPTAQSVATATATLITSLNGGASPSPRAVLGGTSGFPVTTVIVDTVLDTQRRRRNKVQPAGTTSAAVS